MGALRIKLQHRFNGDSFGSTRQLTVDRLRLVTLNQVMADIALFIEYFHGMHPETADAKWIATGCSYPGMLATWARLRLPNLVHGAVAGCAPVGVPFNWVQYDELAGNIVGGLGQTGGSPQCASTLRAAGQLLTELGNSQAGHAELERRMGMSFCKPLPWNEGGGSVTRAVGSLALKIFMPIFFNV